MLRWYDIEIISECPFKGMKFEKVPEKNINWDDYNFTKQQFEKLKASHGESRKEINKKFQYYEYAKANMISLFFFEMI